MTCPDLVAATLGAGDLGHDALADKVLHWSATDPGRRHSIPRHRCCRTDREVLPGRHCGAALATVDELFSWLSDFSMVMCDDG